MKKLLLLIGALLAGLAVFGLMGGAATPSESEPVNLAVARVANDDLIESTVATGTVKPKVGAEVKVGSQISGVVVKLNVNVGDNVRKGDLLAMLDDSSLRARVNTLKAEVAAATAEYQYAVAELKRFERSSMSLALSQIEDSRRNVAVRRAEVDQAKARLADTMVQLGYTRIVAPISGTVASVSTYVGETVAASFAAPTFLTIVDLANLEVQAYVDETDIGKVEIGQPLQFRIDSFPDRQLRGAVRAIYPKAQLVNNVVNYVLLIDILDAADLQIRPEMTARVNLILAQKADVMTVPRSALVNEGGSTYVVAKTDSGWAMRPVKTGMKTVQLAEVVSGVREGETIVRDAQRWKDSQGNDSK